MIPRAWQEVHNSITCKTEPHHIRIMLQRKGHTSRYLCLIIPDPEPQRVIKIRILLEADLFLRGHLAALNGKALP